MAGFADIQETFRNSNSASVTGVNGEITVEVLSADPTLTAGEPRIWLNTTAGALKFSHDGATVLTVTAS